MSSHDSMSPTVLRVLTLTAAQCLGVSCLLTGFLNVDSWVSSLRAPNGSCSQTSCHHVTTVCCAGPPGLCLWPCTTSCWSWPLHWPCYAPAMVSAQCGVVLYLATFHLPLPLHLTGLWPVLTGDWTKCRGGRQFHSLTKSSQVSYCSTITNLVHLWPESSNFCNFHFTLKLLKALRTSCLTAQKSHSTALSSWKIKQVNKLSVALFSG